MRANTSTYEGNKTANLNISDLLASEESKEGFYPTPEKIADEMLSGINFTMIGTVLEPSGGKGNLIDALLRRHYASRGQWGNKIDVDVCEIDPYLRSILKYNFCGEKEHELYEANREFDKWAYSSLTQAQKAQKNWNDIERRILESGEVHIVHDDFLTYRTFKHYDLILMNPPFANGDEHLLRALEMQKTGGAIVCLLNAETIRNPYTNRRQVLKKLLDKYGAEITYIDDAFSNAERKARVDVAIVKVNIEPAQEESEIWERMQKAVDEDNTPDPELHQLVVGDYIEQAIQLYRTEVAATMELVRQYRALVPYMYVVFNAKDQYEKTPILNLCVGDHSSHLGFEYKAYMKLVRLKYWRALFKNEKFTGKLTSELQEKYREKVEKMADYEFSAFNIKQVLAEMNAEMTQGVEKAILDLFDKLTVEHTWFPECQQNRHYFNGWATNKAHKIGNKCIIPTHGMFASYSWAKETFEVHTAFNVIGDIEKAFNYLDGGLTEEVDLLARLKAANANGITRNIDCKYFKIDLFKKGTTHIKFKPEAMKLVDRLNIYASRKKNWLPPNYGKKTYSNMTPAEKTVIDSFHGDGEPGSGELQYTRILRNAAFYLEEPANNGLKLLTEGD